MYIIKGTIKGYEDKPPTYLKSFGNEERKLNLTVIKSKATQTHKHQLSSTNVAVMALNNDFPWATWEVVEV